MSHWHNETTDLLCDALLSLKTREEAYAFLDDVATVKEILDLAQRLSVARMLDEGAGYTEVCEFLCSFHSPTEAYGAWEPDKEYEDYQFWLARTEDGGWQVVNWGY